MASVRYNNLRNALAKHCSEKHEGTMKKFNMRAMSQHRTVLNRYKSEAVYIEKQQNGTSLNNKDEGG